MNVVPWQVAFVVALAIAGIWPDTSWFVVVGFFCFGLGMRVAIDEEPGPRRPQ